MKYLVALAILGMLCASALADGRFELERERNASVEDPDRTLNYRRTWMFYNPLLKIAGFKSLALEDDDEGVQVDSLVGFISYQNAPVALLAYLNSDHEWDDDHAELNTCTFVKILRA